MCEILIKVRDYVNADPVKDRRGVHKKGDIINIKPDGWSDHPNWSQSAYPYANGGKFVLVKVPGLAVETALAYRDSWRDDFAYEITATRPAQGEYDVRIFEKNAGAINQNAIAGVKATRVRDYLQAWGCHDFFMSATDAGFTFDLWNAVRSPNFWETPLIGTRVSFALVSYVGATGIGTITVTAIQEAWGEMTEAQIAKEISDRITEKGGTVTATSGLAVTFTIERGAILMKFYQDVKRRMEDVYKRHQYSISAAEVDAISAQGGIVTMSLAQLLGKIINHMG